MAQSRRIFEDPHVIAEVAPELYTEEEPDEGEGEAPSPEQKAEQERNRVLKARCVAAIMPFLKDTDPSVRWNAARALGVLEAEANRVMPALIEMVRTDLL
jgi:hypothetical protein